MKNLEFARTDLHRAERDLKRVKVETEEFVKKFASQLETS